MVMNSVPPPCGPPLVRHHSDGAQKLVPQKPYRIMYDHSWQNPTADDYDPWRVIKETPEMKHGRKEYVKPTIPPGRPIGHARYDGY